MKVAPESYELEDWELTQRKLGRREFADAEFLVRRKIARHGLRPAYAALLARVLKRVGKYNEALSTLDESLAQHPNSMRLHAEKGDTHFARMNYVLAAESYAMALSADEEDCTNPIAGEFIQDNLAMSRHFLGDSAYAVEQLEPLVVTHPEKARFRDHYTQALAKNAGDDVGIDYLPNIESKYMPGFGAFLCSRLLAEKRFYDALRCSGQLIAKYPDNPQSIRCHANALYRLLHFDEAIDVLESAVRNQNIDAALYITLGNCYKATKQVHLERESCLAGLFRFPENLPLLLRLFEIDWACGRKNECSEYSKRILKIPEFFRNPSTFTLYNILGTLNEIEVPPKIGEEKQLKKCVRGIMKQWMTQFAAAIEPDDTVLPENFLSGLPRVVFRNNAAANMDIRSELCTIENACRSVVNQPSAYEYTVFIVGHCMTILGAGDSATLGSVLQDVFNSRSGKKVRIVNYGGAGSLGAHDNVYLQLLYSDELQPGDKVLYYDRPPDENYRHDYDAFLDRWVAEYARIRNELTRRGVELYLGFSPSLARDSFQTLMDDILYETLHEFKKMPSRKDAGDIAEALSNRLIDNEFIFRFFDDVLQYKTPDSAGRFWWDEIHYSVSLNRFLAESIYDLLSLTPKMKQIDNLPSLKKQSMDWLRNLAFARFRAHKDIHSWIRETHDAEISNHKNVGAIVMNCNPFTLGHRYLVEKALESVEALYLFVVEEDLSQFSFADRLMLVKEGVRDFGGRVKVVPSGKFIISSFSFAEYFTKAVEITPPDSTTDVLIFASMIAPALNIRMRFVGEEPTCMVTRSYNERMLQLLPDMGCAVNVIPRKEIGGGAISASRVRKALEENDLELIRSLVPDTTYAYLMQPTQHNTDYRPLIYFCQNQTIANKIAA